LHLNPYNRTRIKKFDIHEIAAASMIIIRQSHKTIRCENRLVVFEVETKFAGWSTWRDKPIRMWVLEREEQRGEGAESLQLCLIVK
jgi:hypothetical protein